MPRTSDKINDQLAYNLVVEHGLSIRKAAQAMRERGISIGNTTVYDAVQRMKRKENVRHKNQEKEKVVDNVRK